MADPERPPSHALRRGLWALALVAVLAAAAWLLGARPGPGLLPGAATARPPPLAFVRPTRGPVRDVIIAKGTVSYPLQLTLRAQRSGRLASLAVAEGSSVLRGQAVAELVDPQDDLDRQSLDLDLQRIQAKREALEREIADMRRLLAVGGLARHELEQKELELSLAVKDAERVRVDSAKLAERQRHSRHSSPLGGLVLAVPVTPGQWLNQGDELLTLAGGAGPNVTAQIDAMDLDRVQLGQAVVFSAQEDGGTRRRGRIREIGRAVSAGQRQNTVKVTIAPAEALAELRVAQQLYVEVVVLDEADVLRLPKEYFYRQGPEVMVQLLTDQGPQPRRVLTRPGDAAYDIVLGGLGPDDRVVLPAAAARPRP